MRATVVRAAVLKNYSEVARELGLNAGVMLRRAGLSLAMLSDPERMVPLKAALKLLEDSATESACPSFGLRMAETRQLSDFGVVSLLISHQRTLRDALLTTIEYRHLLNQTLAMHLEEAGKEVIIQEEVMTDPGVPKQQATELAIGILFRMCAGLVGNRWNPRSVNFTHSAPKDKQIYVRMFRCKVQFDADFNGIICAATDLDCANPQADAAMATFARRFTEASAGFDEQSVAFDVRKAIYLLLPVGRATVNQVAHGLGMSVRTLQRQLDDAGVTFSDLLNGTRRELVVRYMANRKYSLQRVGMMLGYAVPSSFTRWFLIEFGTTPRSWRRKNITAEASLPNENLRA